MKIKRIILLFGALFTVATVFAQNPLTIRCEETGDSIPYLMEHVRNREPWAYENLARCYRFGIGVEKCITNAMIYYGEAEINQTELAENAYASDPTDELGFMNYIMDSLAWNRITIEAADSLLNSYPEPKPSWMACMKKIFENRNIEDLENYILSSIDLKTATGDDLAASVACLVILRPDNPSVMSKPSSPEFLDRLTLAAEKIPVLYMVAGDRYRALHEDCPNDEHALKNAFELYHKAYLHGLLGTRGAVEVLDFRDNNPLYDGFPFSREELAHLDGFYSKEYRDQYNSPCVAEECVVEEVVEFDEDPVVVESELSE